MVPDEEQQRSNWTVMESYLRCKIEELNESSLEKTFKDILGVNILLGHRNLVRLILERPDLSKQPDLYAALAAKLNSVAPEIGATLSREAAAIFIEAYNNFDDAKAYSMVSLLAELFNYEVLHEIVILQVIHLLSKDLTEPSVRIIVQLLWQCGKHLSEVSLTAHNMIFEKLRQVLQAGKLSNNAKSFLQELFDLRSRDYIPCSAGQLLKIEDLEHNTHTFMIDSDEFKPLKNLGEFEYHEDFIALERRYEILRAEALAAYETEEVQKPTVATDMTGEQEVEFKKRFYLILKSSLSSDEAAHKILKLRVPDADKHRVVDVIIKSSIQEATYSKFYGTLAERLCSSHKSWKPAFELVFKSNYQNSEEFEPAQLRTLGKLWGHILASDYVGLEVFENVHMSEDGTTAPGRIFLKFIFQEMVASLGIDELANRFKEEYIQPFLVNLFPKEDTDNIRYSINYFTAIGLGVLTEDMRQRLDILQAEVQKIRKDRDGEQTQVSQQVDSRYRSSERRSRRDRSVTPPRRQRRASVTPPKRRYRSRSPISRHR
ncbi:hypothetical protein HG536_0A00390 [Torulaspora globosa]|uniref:Pre-mRNA-splicing factor CWC22 n=1 Tax=Torulaspora globosa TaxID=48254 RepID=A0A7G3Z9N6_9SACH|nr:uncharacterized protein HG536_0A00390 [Torulaspora globosa]QLL30222.1 hypothetical protein HG536_0A00390 [Torulaspora globosa]